MFIQHLVDFTIEGDIVRDRVFPTTLSSFFQGLVLATILPLMRQGNHASATQYMSCTLCYHDSGCPLIIQVPLHVAGSGNTAASVVDRTITSLRTN